MQAENLRNPSKYCTFAALKHPKNAAYEQEKESGLWFNANKEKWSTKRRTIVQVQGLWSSISCLSRHYERGMVGGLSEWQTNHQRIVIAIQSQPLLCQAIIAQRRMRLASAGLKGCDV